MCLFAEQVFRSTYFCCWKHIAVDSEFLFYRLLKNITKFRLAVLGPRPMTWLNKTSQNKKRRPLFSKNVLKIVPIHVYKFSFLIPRIHTEFLVIIFDRAENRSSTLVWETRGDCCLKSLKEKQIILYSQHLPKKTLA